MMRCCAGIGAAASATAALIATMSRGARRASSVVARWNSRAERGENSGRITRPLTDQARHLLQAETRVILPLFSPRSALLFHRATTELARLAPLDIVAMSAAVAQAAAPIPAQHRIIAAEPTEAAMVWSVLTRLRQNPDLKETGSAR